MRRYLNVYKRRAKFDILCDQLIQWHAEWEDAMDAGDKDKAQELEIHILLAQEELQEIGRCFTH